MVLNDFKADGKKLLKGKDVKHIAEQMLVHENTVRGYCDYAGVTKGYVKLCEHLGWDIKITYVKRKQ